MPFRHRLAAVAAALSIASAAVAAPPGPVATAKRFVERLYGLAGPPVPEERMYTPALARLIQQGYKVAAKTDDPDLVGDALCDCQNLSELHARITVVSATPAAASVRVLLTGHVDGPRRFLLKLAPAPDGWRLADSIAEPGGSYARNLRANIAGR